MKKLICFLLSFSLLLSTSGFVFALNDCDSYNGIIMSVDDFVQQNSDDGINEATSSKNSAISNESVSISYQNIAYNASTHNLSFIAVILSNEEVYELNISGNLYNSMKVQYGINSIVGDMTEESGNFDVLYFEIFNSYDENFVHGYMTDTHPEGPELKIYLQNDEKLYFFETAIPEQLQSIQLNNTEENLTDNPEINAFWFTGLIEPTYTVMESDTDVEDIARAQYSDEVNLPTYSANWTISGTVYTYCAVPHIEYRLTDATENDSSWWANFNISDTYAYVGSVKYANMSGLRFTNIDISFSTGPYTRVLSAGATFSLTDTYSSSVPSSVTGSLAAFLGLSSNASLTAASALASLLSTATSSQKLVSGTSTLLSTQENNVRAFRYLIPVRYFMQYTTDYVEYTLKITSYDYNSAPSDTYNVSAQMRIGFDYYAGSTDNIATASPTLITQAYKTTI